LFVQQKSKKGFIFRCFRRYQQAEKAARLQVVWSWRPVLFSAPQKCKKPAWNKDFLHFAQTTKSPAFGTGLFFVS
jgi:hypothetical protein